MSACRSSSPASSAPPNTRAQHSRFKLSIVESDPAVRDYLQMTLGERYELSLSEELATMCRMLEREAEPHLLIVAWHSRAISIPLLLKIRSLLPKLPVVLLAYSSELESLIAYTQLGIRAVVVKPFLGDELEAAIGEQLISVEHKSLQDGPVEIPLNETHSFVRCSKRMREIEAQARLVARADIPVLILGESGTGKEILARYTHLMSARNEQTFLKVNCAAMPTDLVESELFGYEQGAFTGAMKLKQGKFEMCHHGTIFLDEIGEMHASLQAKLLQVLQDGTFSRLGGRSSIKVDVRVIAATNINMKEAIAQKKFREDLYYRLNGFTLNLPPLRERRDEIPVLADYFMKKASKRYGHDPLFLSPQLISAMTEYAWPGNLRELENVVNRYLVMGSESAIMQELMPSSRPQHSPMDTPLTAGAAGLKRLVRDLKNEAESIAIAEVLEVTGWNRKAAASDLKISYKALLYKIKQYNLEPRMQAS
jgi:two-component system, NtrC family, response regulator AtoC